MQKMVLGSGKLNALTLEAAPHTLGSSRVSSLYTAPTAFPSTTAERNSQEYARTQALWTGARSSAASPPASEKATCATCFTLPATCSRSA